ncbi:PDZ domain-containing protein [Brevibacillus sp. SYSU BS000544]|uniref:PDZ domain-containing protein n=1 Tax=Brevibacillus sp. SYSU BS000544 TaxID=3416443 RepID=UPI003CE4A100
MAYSVELLINYLTAFVHLLLNPLLYVFVLFIYLQYRKQMVVERQLFSARIQSPLKQTVRSIGMGLVGGIIASISAGLLGIMVQETDMWLLWFLSLGLALIRIRFFCLAYSAGILTLLHMLTLLAPNPMGDQGVGIVWTWLANVNPVPLLALVGLLHLIEAMLIRWNAGRDASPLFVEGKRGRIVGAYHLQSFWLTPLLFLVPSQASGLLSTPLYPGWPLFSPENIGLGMGYGLMLLPAVTGFSDLTQTMVSKEKARQASRQLFIYALLLLGLSYASVWLPWLAVFAALYTIAGHEGLFVISQRREQSAPPYFIQSPKGIKVMAVLPDTPAEQMGILPGEIIVKVNGIPVQDKTQLYPALQANPAFCKMEVLTYNNEQKFVQCAIYAGNHHQLGIIVVPDSSTNYFVEVHKMSLIQLIKDRMEKIKLGA